MRLDLVFTGAAPSDETWRRAQRARDLLAAHTDARLVPPATDGLDHEAGSPQSRAARLIDSLADGAVAILASFPWRRTRGDLLSHQVLPYLPEDLEGVVVGGFEHATFLSILRHRSPRLRALVGPSLTLHLGALEQEAVDRNRALYSLLRLLTDGPQPLALLNHARREAAWGDELSGARARSAGRVFAGNLLALALLSEKERAIFRGAILLCDFREVRDTVLLYHYRRLQQLGCLSQVSTAVFARPSEIRLMSDSSFSMTPERLSDILCSDFPMKVILDGFEPFGAAPPLLELGRPAQLTEDGWLFPANAPEAESSTVATE